MYEKLKEMRLKKHYTQADLARVIDVSLPNYCKKENGQVPFTLTEALLIADFLGTKVEKIFLRDNLQ